MSESIQSELKYYLLIFGIILLIVFLSRKAFRKVIRDREAKGTGKFRPKQPGEKPLLTEEQYQKSWKALSFLLLVAAAGNLYMVYVALKNVLLPNGLWVWWIDAAFSFLAAITAIILWRKRTKIWVYVYFVFTLVPIFLFMSIQGGNYKVSALIHLFPLVLLYLVLQPVWKNLES